MRIASGAQWFAAKDPEQLERDRQRGRRDLLGHLLGDTPGFVFAEVLVVLEANADELLHRGANTAELVLLDRRELTFTALAEARREVVEDGGQAVRGGRRHSEHVSHVSQAGVVRGDALQVGQLAKQPRPGAGELQPAAVEAERAEPGAERHVVRGGGREGTVRGHGPAVGVAAVVGTRGGLVVERGERGAPVVPADWFEVRGEADVSFLLAVGVLEGHLDDVASFAGHVREVLERRLGGSHLPEAEVDVEDERLIRGAELDTRVAEADVEHALVAAAADAVIGADPADVASVGRRAGCGFESAVRSAVLGSLVYILGVDAAGEPLPPARRD